MADLPELQAYKAEAERICVPITPRALIRHLEALFLLYPARDMTEAENSIVWAAWIEDFADVPEDILVVACRTWRRSAERFAPSPGQLLAIIGGEAHWGKTRQRYADRAATVLEFLINKTA